MAQGHSLARRRLAQPAPDDVTIPDKVYFRIGEVSELTQTKPYVLRYWETEFPTLRPTKTNTGHRLYRRKDVATILEIKRLLYQQGFTIDGARKQLSSNKENGSGRQRHLFNAVLNDREIKAIKHELQAILTMLSRRC